MSETRTENSGHSQANAERVIYSGPELLLSQLEVELADGDRLWWDTVRLLRTVSVALVDERQRVLMLHRKRITAQRWGWELPGAVIDDDEDPAESAARELGELAGYQAARLELVCTLQPAPRAVDGERVIFVGQGPERRPELSAAADGPPLEWLPLASVAERLSSGQIWDSATLVALLGLLAGTW